MSSMTDKRLIFILGNDGAGKTSVSAALALLASRRGKRVLVVSSDQGHRLGYAFDWEIGEQGAAVCAGVHALEIEAVKEEALFERICRLVEDAEDYYDLVIFDNVPAHPTLATTETSSECLELYERCQRRFQNAQHSAFLFVATPDSASIANADSAVRSLQDASFPLHGLLFNKVSDESVEDTYPLLTSFRLPLMPTEIHGIGVLQQVAVQLDQSGV